MRNSLFIQFFAFILSAAMLAEVSLPLQLADAISIEIDSETEHEESNEKEKEKTTHNLDSSKFHDYYNSQGKKVASNHDSNWISPSIDFITPPPELI
ncbi:hypothetical protein [Ekhidna sp.]|uniref:hypothetical protein n=1 Tax=Ekhidna sp. TaxID=2608089 RepID=UPI003B50545C